MCVGMCFSTAFKSYGTWLRAKSWNSRVELIVLHFLFFFSLVVVLQNSNMKVKQEPLAGVERNLLSRGEAEMPGRRQELGRAFFFQ